MNVIIPGPFFLENALLAFEMLDHLTECWRIDQAPVFQARFSKVCQAQPGGRPDSRFQTFPNQLAADFYSTIVVSVAYVLKQMRHFWK